MSSWYDCVKSKCEEKAKLCCMDTDSFAVKIKIEAIYAEIACCFKVRFDTWNYGLDRSLSKRKNKKSDV